MEHLGPLDAVFVNAEDGISHMHIGSCAVFEGPAPAFTDLLGLVAAKLGRLPRYRQRLRVVPGALAHPVWVDDADFRLGYHVRRTALPAPGGEAELDALVGRLMSQELDRRRPLWEAWVVEGLEGGRWALVSKVHHCMVDGISGTDLIGTLLDDQPDTTIGPPSPWHPARAPSDAELMAAALRDLAVMPLRLAQALARQAARPRAALAHIGDSLIGARSLGRFLRPSTPVSIEGSIGAHRRWAAARCTLDDVRTIRAAFGGSVNDVVLAVCAGAFRDLLLARGDPVEHVSLRTLVPVSVRAPDDHAPNNQVSMIVAELPIDVADPVERLAAVRARMAELKRAHQVDAGVAAVSLATFTPPALQALAVRGLTALWRRVPQHNVNTVTTNVPGPQHPLYALGRRMVDYLPFVPLTSGVRIGIAIVSYDGRIAFGVTGDFDAAPDVGTMAQHIEDQMDALRTAATLAAAPARAVAAGR
jgi:diacylglycerol O-acyltransferase